MSRDILDSPIYDNWLIGDAVDEEWCERCEEVECECDGDDGSLALDRMRDRD